VPSARSQRSGQRRGEARGSEAATRWKGRDRKMKDWSLEIKAAKRAMVEREREQEGARGGEAMSYKAWIKDAMWEGWERRKKLVLGVAEDASTMGGRRQPIVSGAWLGKIIQPKRLNASGLAVC
jgi:hypothetical protein